MGSIPITGVKLFVREVILNQSPKKVDKNVPCIKVEYGEVHVEFYDFRHQLIGEKTEENGSVGIKVFISKKTFEEVKGKLFNGISLYINNHPKGSIKVESKSDIEITLHTYVGDLVSCKEEDGEYYLCW